MPSIVDDVSNRRHTHGSTMCEMSHVAFLYKFKENKSKLRKSHLGVAQIVAWFILDRYIFFPPPC